MSLQFDVSFRRLTRWGYPREYIREANAQRKFDDAKTLKISLEEIRQEIARLAEMG